MHDLAPVASNSVSERGDERDQRDLQCQVFRKQTRQECRKREHDRRLDCGCQEHAIGNKCRIEATDWSSQRIDVQRDEHAERE